jgi:hypothetical protein
MTAMTLAELQRRYIVMRDGLKRVDRDIVFSLCQYGMQKHLGTFNGEFAAVDRHTARCC